MPTKMSSLPRSTSLLPTASSQGKHATKLMGRPSTLTLKRNNLEEASTPITSSSQSRSSSTMVRTPASRTSSTEADPSLSKTQSHSRSTSKLPKSPNSRLPSPASTDSSGKKSKESMTTDSTTRVSRPKTPSPRSSANKSSDTPLPKVIVTPSAPPAPGPAFHRAAESNIPTPLTPSKIKPLELVPKEMSPYIAAHLGEPCTVNALDHFLTCGHKVITTAPEACATNCQNSPRQHANPRSLDQSFVCLTCILSVQQIKHAERVASFKQELQQVAKTTRKTDPERWIVMKIGFMEKAWSDVEMQEMRERVKEGRFAYPVYVEPGKERVMLEVVGAALRERGRRIGETAMAAGDLK